MKFKYITKSIIPTLAVILSLSSCLKDDNINQDFTKLIPMVGFADASPSGVRANSTSVGIVSSDPTAVINLEVGYFSDKENNGATVNIELDAATLAEFPATYNLLDPAFYEFPSSVTIPAGAKTVEFPITVKPEALIDADEENSAKLFAIPVKISSVTGGAEVSGNFGRHVVLISIKNKYDGVYSVKGEITRNSAAGPDLTLGGKYTGQSGLLVTVSPDEVWFNAPKWKDGSSVGGIGSTDADGVIFKVDPATNKVTITAEGNPSLKNTAGYDSRWDEATKTFYVAFDWGAAPNTRLVVDTLVRTGDRP